MPGVYDQGQLGSCTAQAVAAVIEYRQQVDDPGWGRIMPSRLQLYYNARSDKTMDTGCDVVTAINVAATFGVCPENDWPYVVERFAEPPPTRCVQFATTHRIREAGALVSQTESGLKGALAGGHPVIGGVMVYPGLTSGSTEKDGLVRMPSPGETEEGGHCIVVCGYDNAMVMPNGKPGAFLVRNSWGRSWGQTGYCWFPYEYMVNTRLAADFYTIAGFQDIGPVDPFWSFFEDYGKILAVLILILVLVYVYQNTKKSSSLPA
jgi:C1A family cysteine protease